MGCLVLKEGIRWSIAPVHLCCGLQESDYCKLADALNQVEETLLVQYTFGQKRQQLQQ